LVQQLLRYGVNRFEWRFEEGNLTMRWQARWSLELIEASGDLYVDFCKPPLVSIDLRVADMRSEYFPTDTNGDLSRVFL
jgi:hypothetical protein